MLYTSLIIHACNVRYYVRATLQLRSGGVIVQQEVSIHIPSLLPEVTRNIKTEIALGEALHLELECNKWKLVQFELAVQNMAS